MNDEERAKFLAERRDAIGGSDVHHLLGLDYGCERRLWYDKSGVEPDFEHESKHMRRGSALEAPAVQEFNREAKGLYHAVGPMPWYAMPGVPHLGAHIDGLVGRRDGPAGTQPAYDGVLELKVPSAFNWYRMRMEGPDRAHELQLQWYMMVREKSWGLIYIFNADAWQGHWFERERDEEMVRDLRYLADRFWPQVLAARRGPAEGPERLDGRDRRCRTCPWRLTCQGIDKAWVPEEDRPAPNEVEEHDESLFDAVADYLAAQALKRSGERALEEAKARLLHDLGPTRRLVSTSIGRVVRKETYTKSYTVPERRGLSLRVIPAKRGADDGEDETQH